MTVLRFDDVWFAYGDQQVLRGTSLALEAGETVALLGPNGVGKTTLTKLIVGLLHPGRGAVSVCGRSTQDRVPEQLARQVAYVFQHPDQQLFERSVSAEVAFAPRLRALHTDDVEALVRDALRRTGLENLAEEHPFDLPPAQRKLVALAAALAQRPQLLVLDEPTQGLDRSGRARVVEVVHGLRAEGVAVLAVTHDPALVAEAFERSLVLEDGRIAHDGPTAVLLSDSDLLAQFGLTRPPAASLSMALDLPERPIRIDDVAKALAARLAPRYLHDSNA
jgi:energy-coupling factor transport system ATP-binding protein